MYLLPHRCLTAKICLHYLMPFLYEEPMANWKHSFLEEVLSFQKLFTEWKSDDPRPREWQLYNMMSVENLWIPEKSQKIWENSPENGHSHNLGVRVWPTSPLSNLTKLCSIVQKCIPYKLVELLFWYGHWLRICCHGNQIFAFPWQGNG